MLGYAIENAEVFVSHLVVLFGIVHYMYTIQDNSGAVLQYDKFVIEDGTGEF